MKDLLTEVADLNKTLFFIFLCLVSIFVAVAGKTLLVSEDLYFEFFGDQLAYERIIEIIAFQKKWEWLSYAIVPLYQLVKIFLVGLCIYTGAILTGIEISYKKVFETALVAESIFLLPGIFKLCWFTFIQTRYTLHDIQFFYPLSVINFFDRAALDVWWIYPLQLMNIFEVTYFLMLAYGLFIVTQKSFVRMLGLVTCTYGAGLFIWTISVMFLTISFST